MLCLRSPNLVRELLLQLLMGSTSIDYLGLSRTHETVQQSLTAPLPW